MPAGGPRSRKVATSERQYPEPLLFAVVAVVDPPLPVLPPTFTTCQVPPKLVIPSPLVDPAAASPWKV